MEWFIASLPAPLRPLFVGYRFTPALFPLRFVGSPKWFRQLERPGFASPASGLASGGSRFPRPRLGKMARKSTDTAIGEHVGSHRPFDIGPDEARRPDEQERAERGRHTG